MTARTGMTQLIETVRGYVDAGTADYTIGSTAYWSDDEIQRVLDQQRTDFYRDQLQVVQTYGSGTVEYKTYLSSFQNLEESSGGTAVFWLENAAGSVLGTALWSADYIRGEITFASDTLGSSVMAYGRSYDLYGAAAAIWRHKAANVSKAYDFSTDNHSLKRSQMMTNFLEMAKYYEGFKAPEVVQLYREDMQ
jgi:hypothetical protein